VNDQAIQQGQQTYASHSELKV